MATRFEPEGDVDDRFLLPVVVLELAIVEVEDVAGGGSRLAKASGAASVEGADPVADPFPRMAAQTLGGASSGRDGRSILRDLSGWSMSHFIIFGSLWVHMALYSRRLQASL